MNKRQPPAKRDLRRLYEDELLSLRDIGRLYRVAASTVIGWMEEYGIPRRPSGRTSECPDCGYLRDLYEVQKLSSSRIARQFSVTETCARSWLKRCGIKMRPPGSAPRVRFRRGSMWSFAENADIIETELRKERKDKK
jgi:hypothetical protein